MATRALDSNNYAGCNILCADAESAAVIHSGDWLRVRLLPPGIHVLTNRDVNDGSDPRLLYALDWLSRRKYGCSQEVVVALEDLCARTATAARPSPCATPTAAPCPAASSPSGRRWKRGFTCTPRGLRTRRAMPTIRTCCAIFRRPAPTVGSAIRWLPETSAGRR